MSAFTKKPFASVAPLLAEYGYHPVPIKPSFKAPLLDDWQTPKPFQAYLPHVDPKTRRRTDCGSWGTGILTRNCPAVDLDIRDRELVRVLIELAAEMLGPSPFRIGAPPKALLPFSTSTPFDRITGRWWALPGEDYGAEGYAAHRVEILGNRQQFLAFARHPRGTYYRWRRYSPISTARAVLPPIDEAEARAFLATAEDILQRVGATPVVKQNGLYVAATERAAKRRRSAPSNPQGPGWQQLNPETLVKAIDARHARRTRNGWITSCSAHRSEGHRSLHVTPCDGGRGSVVHRFGECSFVEIAREIEAIVGMAA